MNHKGLIKGMKSGLLVGCSLILISCAATQTALEQGLVKTLAGIF